ncbi:MAG: hypothetical protein ACI9NC_002647, partial [Verrucomicrobiales bacterium]
MLFFVLVTFAIYHLPYLHLLETAESLTSHCLKGSSGNLLWKWGAEKIPAGEAINAKLSGDSGRFSNEDSG